MQFKLSIRQERISFRRQAAEGLGIPATALTIQPPPPFTYKISNNRLTSSGARQRDQRSPSRIHFSLCIVCSFVLSLTLPCPLLFFLCSLPHEFSFLSLVIGNPHAICHSIACRHLLCRLSLQLTPTDSGSVCGGVRNWTLPFRSCPVDRHAGFVGALAKLRKVTASLVMSVCLSVRMEQLGSHWTDFHEI
jgi:hypothetical protein